MTVALPRLTAKKTEAPGAGARVGRADVRATRLAEKIFQMGEVVGGVSPVPWEHVRVWLQFT